LSSGRFRSAEVFRTEHICALHFFDPQNRNDVVTQSAELCFSATAFLSTTTAAQRDFDARESFHQFDPNATAANATLHGTEWIGHGFSLRDQCFGGTGQTLPGGSPL
jgi:hypothetical protein